MKKLFVVSDVHGFYDELIEGLRAAGFEEDNPDHIFVNLGDLLDRGNQPLECLEFVKKMSDSGRAILIKGNHEKLMEQIIIYHRPLQSYDVHNGTVDTLCIIGGSQDITEAKNKARENELLNWYLRESDIYYKLVGNNLFIHACVPYLSADYNTFIWNDQWERAIWEDPIETWSLAMSICRHGVKFEDTVYGKYNVYCGHRAAVYANLTVDYNGVSIEKEVPEKIDTELFKTFHGRGINILDSGTMVSRMVNCEVVEIEDEEWYDAVQVQEE